jgi:hypothetical protein
MTWHAYGLTQFWLIMSQVRQRATADKSVWLSLLLICTVAALSLVLADMLYTLPAEVSNLCTPNCSHDS